MITVTALIRADSSSLEHTFDITAFLEGLGVDELEETREALGSVSPPGSSCEGTDSLVYAHEGHDREIGRVLWYCEKVQVGFSCSVNWKEFEKFYDSRFCSKCGAGQPGQDPCSTCVSEAARGVR